MPAGAFSTLVPDASADAHGPDVVVVLGFGNRADQANLINRYRVRAALRSFDHTARDRLLVLCGGAVRGDIPEADLMASYARRRRGYTGRLALDVRSRSMRENIDNAIPLIETARLIKVVSNSLHAEKGRALLWELRPDLASRLRRGGDYRFGEMIGVMALSVVLAVAARLRVAASHR